MIYLSKYKNKYVNIFLCSVFGLNLIFATELQIGSEIPEVNYKLNDVSGKQITLAEVKGEKGTIVIFSCNTCPWVLKWQKRYVSISKKYKKKGIGVIAINSNISRFDGDDSLEKMIAHAEKNNYNFAYAQDPKAKLAYAFGATKTPHVYLFDDKNTLVYRGAIDDNARTESNVEEAFLVNALDQMLSGKKITKSVSKALGCSIKF